MANSSPSAKTRAPAREPTPRPAAKLPTRAAAGRASAALRPVGVAVPARAAIGNQQMQRALGGHGKLTVGEPSGAHEREADRAAEAFERRRPAPPISPAHDGALRRVSHAAATRGTGGAAQSSAVAQAIGASRGEPLSPPLRSDYERFFGADLGAVRVHRDVAAESATQALAARAFARGPQIFFAPGEYAPHTAPGRALLAHELTHVRQQPRWDEVLRRKPQPGKGVGVGGEDETPAEGKSVLRDKYDTNSKADVLAHAEDWHKQLFEDYKPHMMPGDGYGKAPAEVGISFIRQQRTGRANFIYTVHHWPKLKEMAEKSPPPQVFKATIDAANNAKKDAESEEASGKLIAPADYRTLFPETFAKDYDEEAKSLQKKGIDGFDESERSKVSATQRKNKKAFVTAGTVQYMYRYAADEHVAEAARIRKGQWDTILFQSHRVFFWIQGQRKAESMAKSEYDKYVESLGNPGAVWKEALETKKQWQGDLDKQNKSDADTSGLEKDLAALSIQASLLRNKVGREVLPGEVIDAWNAADQAMVSLRPAAARGAVSDDVRKAAAAKVRAFADGLRGAVKGADVKTTYKKRKVKVSLVDNPYLSPGAAMDAMRQVGQAKSKDQWKDAFKAYNVAVTGMDAYIADQLAAKGRKDEGEQLKLAGGRARELAELLDDHKDAQKVPAVFYPLDAIENKGEAGSPSFGARGIPLLFAIYREGDEWHLSDMTTPQRLAVTSGSGGDKNKPDMAIFGKINSKLRFPKGRVHFQLPDGTFWRVETTEPWRLSEWLTWIGIGIAVIALGIATVGASIPASVIVIGAAVGVAAGVSDIVEKKRAGVLTRQDVVVDGLQIVGSIVSAGSAKLGQIVLSKAAAAGVAASEIGGLAGRAFVPVTLAALGTDVASFALLAGDAKKQLSEIDTQPGTDEDRKLAKLRLVAQLVGMGVITFLAVRGNIKAIGKGTGMHMDVGPNGELTARPLLTDKELLEAAKGMKNADAIEKILGREGLSQELKDRLRAGLSEALSGPVAARKVDELIGRLHKSASPGEIEAVLAELTARSRIGAVCGGEVAARVSPEDAKLLAHLDDATFGALRGASPRDLAAIASVLAKDAKEGARLVRQYRQQLVDYLRTNPLPELAQLEDILAKQGARVATTVKGLYEGIDTSKPPDGWKFKDGPIRTEADGTKVLRTDVVGPDGSTGFFETAYNPATKKVELRLAFMRPRGGKKDLPTYVPKQGEAPALVEGKGTPTAQYVTLYQMKRLGVTAGTLAEGGIRSMRLDDVQNVETIVHLHWLRRQFPSATVGELLEFTPISRHADASVLQAGYKRSGKLAVAGGDRIRIGSLMAHFEKGNPKMIDANKALLERYGFKRDDLMFYGFDVEVPVMPAPPP